MNFDDFMNQSVPPSPEGNNHAVLELAKYYKTFYDSFITVGFPAVEAWELTLIHVEAIASGFRR